MRTVIRLLILIIILPFFEYTGAMAAAQTLPSFQKLIEQAKPYETIVIPAGDYAGPVVIEKSIHIRTKGTVRLINSSIEPAIQILADQVEIYGLEVYDTEPKEAASIYVTTDHNIFDQMTIYTASYGFQLLGADHNVIRDSIIVWKSSTSEEASLSEKRNGIDLYDSHDNRMIGNSISNLHDGIYMEDSDRNLVESNWISHSRYGVHCMYTDDTIIRNNTGSYNVTGAMVMAVHNVEVTGNSFYKQSENVNSQGILLFDAQSSRFHNNKVEGNRVGFYIEQSSDNAITNNQIFQNFIGVQFIEATGNQLNHNVLFGNVIDAEARSSADNDVDNNYWDSFRGIDYNGDGISDTANAINPFFQTMIKARPAFQLFFQSPGMMFLEGLFQADRQSWTTDTAPFMQPDAGRIMRSSDASQRSAGVLGFILIASAITTIFYLGVKRT